MAKVYKFTPGGVRTTFASGLTGPWSLAFDNAGNLFVADGGDIDALGAALYKFTPSGVRSTVASDIVPLGLAFDSAGNLFVADDGIGRVYKFTPEGVRTTFASIPSNFQSGVTPVSLAFQPSTPTAPTDFNGDGKPDWVLYNPSTHQTAIWYMNNNAHVGGASGPILSIGLESW